MSIFTDIGNAIGGAASSAGNAIGSAASSAYTAVNNFDPWAHGGRAHFLDEEELADEAHGGEEDFNAPTR